MNRFKPLKTLIGATVASILVTAQPAIAHQNIKTTVTNDTEILVIGERDRKIRINGFIRSILKPIDNDQYASFRGKICPVAIGLPAEHISVIETRITEVAKFSGIKTGSKNCTPNMAVVIVHDPKDFFKELRETQPAILDGISIAERNRIINKTGPAFAWQAVTTQTGDGGGPTGASTAMSVGSSLTGMTAINNGTRGDTYKATGSRYYKATRLDIRLAVVLIDKKTLEGVTLRQLADYSLLRMIGHTDDIKANNVSERSILSLFTDRDEQQEPPETVTAWDVAFMKSLYKSKGNVSSASQRTIMSKKFDRELVKLAEESSKN